MIQDSIHFFIQEEKLRQKKGLVLIASENYTPESVREVVGSILMNKYVEGNVGSRYYAGCEFIDAIEQETIDRFKKIFKADHVNVQPHSGSQANFAVYYALLQPGDTILSMKLSDGGHLTHGHKVNMSGALYNIVSYGVCPETQLLDYDQLEKLAIQHKPKLIIAGTSSYSQIIDFEKIGHVARSVGAFFLADIAHIAGLVAVGLHPSPVEHADVVTMTTHKTFRGPKGGVILCKKELATKIDRAVMPGTQGGAFMHEIAGKGVAAGLAMLPEFIEYQKQILLLARTMADAFIKLGYTVISGGTQTHLFVIDVRPLGCTGKDIEQALESVGMYVNRNAIPFDTLPPLQAGGIRVGTAALASRGATVSDALLIVELMHIVMDCMRYKKAIPSDISLKVGNITDRLL